MSLRYEQYNSLKKTYKFLMSLIYDKSNSKKMKEIKEAAHSCLRHFPFLEKDGKPIFSNDEFTKN